MKRAIAICMSVIFLVLMYSLVLNVYGITIEQGNKDLVLYCHNATNGKLLGTTATINATNSASAVSLATQSMTNQNTGKFNITVNLAPDTYTLQIDCGHADNLDYTRVLYVDDKRQGLVANAVNTSTASSATIVTAGTVSDKTGYTVSTVQDKTGYTVSTVQDKMGYGLTGNAVNSSTLSATGTTVATATSVTNGVTVTTNNDKTGYTVSTVQDKNGYSLAPNAVNSTTLAASAVGAINGSIGQVTGAVGSVTSGVTVTTNNDKTGYSLTTSDWTTDSDLTPITTALSGNASNWFTSTYQTRLDAAITTRSSHSAADVDNLIGDEQIQQALDGNASNWFTSSYQTNLDRVNSALSGNASNWFTSTYQTRVDAAITTRSSHSAADVWSSATRTLTNFMSVALNSTGISGVTHAVTQNVSSNLSTDHGAGSWASATGFTTPADLFTLSNTTNRTEVALSGNASNWFTSTYQTRLDAAITTRAASTNLENNVSTILANFVTVTNNQDTININVKEVNTTTRGIKGAIDGNASNWFTTSFQNAVNSANGALTGNASNWFVGTYQTRLDAAITSRSSHSAADVWTSVTRTLTNFGLVALNSSGIQSLTQNISYNLSTDHGVGEWNNTYVTTALSSGDKNEIIRGSWQNVSSNLTTDHSAGNWSAISSATSTLVATEVLNATATCTNYKNNSLGCVVESIEKYAR